MSSSVQAGTCFHSPASTASTSRTIESCQEGWQTSLHDLFGSLFLRARLLLLFSSVCRRTFIAKAGMLSEIDVELTSQTVVFAFFVCRKRSDYCRALQFFDEQALRVAQSLHESGHKFGPPEGVAVPRNPMVGNFTSCPLPSSGQGIVAGLTDARFGSIEDILRYGIDVRFTPNSGH
jgi:hypothetical protein